MEQKICEYVKTCPEPTFFHNPDDQALQEAHEEIKRILEEATETITNEVDLRLFRRAEKVLGAIGWTVEEALLLFLYWCISCPEQLAIWAKKHGIEDGVSVSNNNPDPDTGSGLFLFMRKLAIRKDSAIFPAGLCSSGFTSRGAFSAFGRSTGQREDSIP